MKYFVDIEGRAYQVEVGPEGVKLDGRRVAADVRAGDGSKLWHLVLEGRSHTLKAYRREGRGVWEIEIDGRRLRAVALDERQKAIRELTGSAATADGPLEVKAPMPGLVVAVEVDTEQHVAKGQGLIVIEAMKMENELKASAAGRVTQVRVAPGQAVNKGETLLVVERVSSEHGE